MESLFSIFGHDFIFGYGINKVILDFVDTGIVRVTCYRGRKWSYTVHFALRLNGAQLCAVLT